MTRSDLVLEVRDQQDGTVRIGGIAALSPELGEDYWAYRVQLAGNQAIVGFPKFGTIGIGFAQEEDDWNTNLPFTSDTEDIFQHIVCNKGDDAISDDDVREAIRLVQEAARADRSRA